MSLDVAHVSRRFGGVTAAQDVSIQIAPGHIVGLIGPNGAGKSTLVNLITGVLRLDEGNVHVDGVEVGTSSMVGVARAGVSRTFQNIRLLPDSTVLDNVSLGLARHAKASVLSCLLGLPAARSEQRAMQQRATEILQDVGLEAHTRAEAAGLSYGHQRRVEIARAIATQPSYLLLDEPVAGMNDVEAQDLAELLRRLSSKGIGILLIEHNIRFVQALCSHVYVLVTGGVLAEGTPAEVAGNPAVVAAYLGA